MEVLVQKTGDEYTDLEFPDLKGNGYCVRFDPTGRFVHAKLHLNPTESFEPGVEVGLDELEKFLLSKNSSLEEIKSFLSCNS